MHTKFQLHVSKPPTEVISDVYLFYEENADGYTLVSYNGDEKDLWLPSFHKKKPVTEIAKDAFKHRNIYSVILPPNLIRIGARAFQSNSLSEVIFPTDVKFIGDYAFDKNKLKKIVLNESLEEIGYYTFSNNLLKEVNMPSGKIKKGVGIFRNNDVNIKINSIRV